MDVPFAVREQLLQGRQFIYRRRPEWNITIRDVISPGDAVRAAKGALGAMLPAEYEVVAVSLADRKHGVATVRDRRLRPMAAGSSERPGTIERPSVRGLAKMSSASKSTQR